jgi:hypothetical protein
MRNRRSILLTILLLGACKTVANSPQSRLDTTSDKLKEFGYIVEGSIELPLNEKAYKTMYLVDTYAHYSEMPKDSSEAADLLARLGDTPSFQDDFAKSMKNGWPLMAGDKLDGSKIKYWIARQLKFNENQLREVKLSATLKDIRKWTSTIDKSRNVAVVKYEALVLGVRQITVGDNLKVSPINNGYEMTIPLNPVSFYFDSLGSAGSKIYKTGTEGSIAAAKALLIKEQMVESTKTAASCLVSEDASTIFPFNSFYYYRFKNGCAASTLTVAKVLNTELIAVDTRYPEFHRLFEDKKVSFFAFYGQVDNEDEDAKQFGAEMKKRGYKQQADDGSGIMVFTNVIAGITFEVTLAVEKLAMTARSEFRQSIKSSEVVVYDGHAGYGASIDGAFGEPDAYPENAYQIFVLNGCNTYKYGTTQIMHTKSVADFDFHNMNVDVISTYDAVTGHTQQRVVLQKLEEAARLLQAGNWTDKKKAEFEKSLSWLSIITAVNKDSDHDSQKDNGIFMVSGEESNDYMPGKKSYLIAPEASEAELLGLLVDETQDEQLRMRVVGALAERLSAAQANLSLEERIKALQDSCRDMKVKGVNEVVMASTFHSQSCQIKKMRIKAEDKYKGYVLSNDIPISFYANGNLRRASILTATTIDGKSFYGRMSFHENGSVASGTSTSEIAYKGLSFSGSVTFFPDGQLRGGLLSTAGEVEGMSLGQYSSLVFDKAGKIERATLAKAFVLNGLNIPQGSDVIIENGKLKFLTSSSDDLIKLSGNEIQFKNGSATFRGDKPISIYSNDEPEIKYQGQTLQILLFHLNGKVALQAAKYVLPGLPYPCAADGERGVVYHENGSFASCLLASKVSVGGVAFKAGEYLMLDAKGTAVSDQASVENFMRTALKDIIPILDEDLYDNGIYSYEDAID